MKREPYIPFSSSQEFTVFEKKKKKSYTTSETSEICQVL